MIVNPWLVVAIAETIRCADRPLLLLADPGVAPTMAARRSADRYGCAQRGWVEDRGRLGPWCAACEEYHAFRAPHHSVSELGMAGEVEMAEGGLLYLDEVDEFRRTVLRRAHALRHVSVVATACPPTGASDVLMSQWLARMASLADMLGATVVDVREGGAR
jgi:hypothetical protein